jgi:hypothetical protein
MTPTLIALATLCGPTSVPWAQHIDAEARRYHVDPVLVVALIRHESRCDLRARGAKGEIGLGQILPTGNAIRGYAHLPVAVLEEPAMQAHLIARHLRKCLRICRGNARSALGVYSGRRRCGPSKYAEAVMGWWKQAKGARRV